VRLAREPGGQPATYVASAASNGSPRRFANRCSPHASASPCAIVRWPPTIFFAGGHGTMWDFRSDAALARLATDVARGGGVVAAVCHGPAALVDLELDGKKLLADQPVTGFSNAEEAAVQLTGVVPFLLEDALRAAGGRYRAADQPFAAHVEVGRRLVTGQNPASTRGVAEAVIAKLAVRS
jgi:putative intracellular protease/amidase